MTDGCPLTNDQLAAIRDYPAVRSILVDNTTVSITLDWKVGTDEIADVVDIAGQEGRLLGGDTSNTLQFEGE